MKSRTTALALLAAASAGALAVRAGASQGGTSERLQKDWSQKVSAAYSAVEGDAARGRKLREISAESSRKVSAYVRSRPRASDIQEAWRLLFSLDEYAADRETEAEHARAYLRGFPKGEHRAFARYRLASRTIAETEEASEMDAEIARFDRDFPEAYGERGRLRAEAAERALEKGEVERAESLYDAAIALPKTAAEIGFEKNNKGSSWHAWWKERRERLFLFRQSFEDFGGEDLEGKAVRVEDYRGKVLLLEFWASW